MEQYQSSNHRLTGLIQWEPEKDAIWVDDHILLSAGMSNSYLVASDEGDVLINAGLRSNGERHRERYEQQLGRPLNVRKIVLTQSHPDHVGGWTAFAKPDTDIIVQRRFLDLTQERKELAPFFALRLPRVVPGVAMPADQKAEWHKGPEDIAHPVTFGDDYSFEVGGRRFDLYSTPSGETLDSLVVWLPAERTVFTGNLMGALQGSLPHFYTLRGDRDRSLVRFIQDMDRIIDLRPALLITGHGDPICGEEAIRFCLGRLRAAVCHIRDETVRGMNAGKDLHQVMRDVVLPPDLEHIPGRGRLSWYVRAMWEEYTGWFRQESTTELYEVPQRAIWGELVSLAGIDPLLDRAEAHLAADEPVHALHFIDLVIGIEPGHRRARLAEIAALEALVAKGRGELFDEQGWLESELARAEQALDEIPSHSLT